MSIYADELQNELDEELNVDDEAIEVEEEPNLHYDITSYGVDFDVEGLVKRIKRGDIIIPEFQRDFVWKLTESSRLIESLLLGLPVPGIFLAQEQETKKMLVIDGQQRLRSLQYFLDGVFNPKSEEGKQRVFKLEKVQPQFLGKTYETLEPTDQMNLRDCVIHATVVKQDSPVEDDTSIYHIFERLNSGGRKLAPQEIRTAVFHGSLLESIKIINEYPNWRKIYGKTNDRMKDQELVLRFFAMLEGYETYKQPMTEFISLFCKRHRDDQKEKIEGFSELFKQCCDQFSQLLKPFRIGRALNAAFFEAAMVGLAYSIRNGNVLTPIRLQSSYDSLKSNDAFKSAISKSTANSAFLKSRIELAIKAFG